MITLAGIEKVLPRFQDLEVMLQVLARSATGERMNPYTSLWTGVTPGDGPQRFHVVLLDNGRSSILAKKTERQTLKCIRCAACMNACPVYRQTGGHAYGSVYPGPIGAILTPQLMQMHHAQTLPYASSLCGACYEVCPVKINIPEVLLELRSQVVNQERHTGRPVLRPDVPWVAHCQSDFSRAWRFFIRRSFSGASGWACLRERTDGFTRCPAWAANGRRRAICADFRSRHSTAGGRRAAKGGEMSAQFRNSARAHPGSGFSTAAPRTVALPRRKLAGLCTLPRDLYSAAGQLTAEGRLALLIERLREYDAEVIESTPENLVASIAAQLAGSGKHTFVAPEGLAADWLIPGFDWKVDHGLDHG
jgi:ferredoxin